LRDDYQKFSAKGVVILGVSLSDAETHRKFREKYNFPFPLLVDSDQRLTRAYGVLKRMDRDSQPFAYAGRSMFLIGADGRLVYTDPDFKLTDAGWKPLLDAVEKLPRANRKLKQK
jgi:peroxiredoxin Q/BCP